MAVLLDHELVSHEVLPAGYRLVHVRPILILKFRLVTVIVYLLALLLDKLLTSI